MKRESNRSAAGGLARWVTKLATAFILAALLTSARPAQAQWAVFDASVFQQTYATVVNTLKQIEQYKQMIQQARESYLLFNSVYAGFKNWQNFGWVEILDMANQPFFDGIQGIDDLRDLGSMSELSVDELMQLFGEAQTIQRLQTDPAYKKSKVRAKMIDQMNEAHQRNRKRKVLYVRALKTHQRELDKLKTQARDLQYELEAASSVQPADAAAIAGIQGKLQVIQVRQETLKDSLADMLKTEELKEQHDEELFRSYMREAGLQDTTNDVHDATALARNFLGIR